MKKIVLLIILCAAFSESRAVVAVTPPMGWNSYDAFNFSVTEAEFKANVDTIAKKYLQYGWNYAVVDWCWSFPGMGTQATPNQGWTGTGSVTTKLNMDAYGRPMPDTVRHPSARGGLGFKPLADYTHSKGLKFGIHLMRGMYRQAYWANLPVLGTSQFAKDVTDTTSKCPWLDHTFGLKTEVVNGKPQLTAGAQAYLNSLFQLFASWGVDFIKIDDMVQNRVTPHIYDTTIMDGYRKAIDLTGREMVFSSSPGATPIGAGPAIISKLNQWRMADDLWDNWTSVNAMFGLCAQWYPYAGQGHFPDADMIPIGRLSKRGPNGSTRYSNLTRNEQYLVMTLWSIFRSPLIYGGNPAENRTAEDSLLTNADVIAVNQSSSKNRPLATGNYPIWAADAADTNIKYVALFNTTGSTATVRTSLLTAFGKSGWVVKNLWTGIETTAVDSLSASLTTHTSALYKLTPIGYVPVIAPKIRPRDKKPGRVELYELRGRRVDPASETAPSQLPNGTYILRNEKGN